MRLTAKTFPGTNASKPPRAGFPPGKLAAKQTERAGNGTDGRRPPDGKPSLDREGARRADGMINVFPALPIQDAYEEQGRHAAGPHLPWMGRCPRSGRIGDSVSRHT